MSVTEESEILGRLIDVITEVLAPDLEVGAEINSDTEIGGNEGSGLIIPADSLDVVELSGEIEATFEIVIDEEELSNLANQNGGNVRVGALVDLITTKLAE